MEANGRSSVLVTRDGVPSAWLTVSGGEDGIDRIYRVMNPEKLDRFATAART